MQMKTVQATYNIRDIRNLVTIVFAWPLDAEKPEEKCQKLIEDTWEKLDRTEYDLLGDSFETLGDIQIQKIRYCRAGQYSIMSYNK